jgi:hypothetical protein
LAQQQEENSLTTVPPPMGNLDGGSDASLSGSSHKMIKIATCNIQSGRNSQLEMALRALRLINVDLCFLTEAKLMDGIST